DDASAAPDIEHPVALPDPGKIEERARQAATPSPHEVLVGRRIGRQKWGHGNGHQSLVRRTRHKDYHEHRLAGLGGSRPCELDIEPRPPTPGAHLKAIACRR